MSHLYNQNRLSAFGEMILSLLYPLKNQRTLLRTQIWPALILVCALLIIGLGGYLMPRSAFTGQQYHAPPIISPEVLDRIGPSLFEKNTQSIQLTQASTIPGVTGTQSRFDSKIIKPFLVIAGLSFVFFMMSALMSQVHMMRYMVLGEGQENAYALKFQFGTREIKLFWWALVVKLLLPACIILPFYFVVQPIIDMDIGHGVASDPLQLAVWFFAFLMMLRFVMVFPAVACDHKSGLGQAWGLLKGNFFSYILANIWMVALSVLYFSIFFGAPGYLLYKFGGIVIQNVYAGSALVLVSILYFIWAYYMYMASQLALLCRYYYFGMQKLNQ